MSHITTIRFQCKSLAALKEAAPLLGLEFREGQTTHRTYGGRMDPCLHALVLKGDTEAYQIGVVRSQAHPDAYDLNVDFWAQDKLLKAVGGPNMNRLRQEYQVANAAGRMRKKLGPLGFVLKREEIAGRVRLRAVRR